MNTPHNYDNGLGDGSVTEMFAAYQENLAPSLHPQTKPGMAACTGECKQDDFPVTQVSSRFRSCLKK